VYTKNILVSIFYYFWYSKRINRSPGQHHGLVPRLRLAYQLTSDFDSLLAAYEHNTAARCGHSAEDGNLQGGTCSDINLREHLLACD